MSTNENAENTNNVVDSSSEPTINTLVATTEEVVPTENVSTEDAPTENVANEDASTDNVANEDVVVETVNEEHERAVEILANALQTPTNSDSNLENEATVVSEEDIVVVVAETNVVDSQGDNDLELDPEDLVESVESIYLELKNSVSGLGINPANYIVIVTKVIEKVDKVKSLSGDESLQLAMDVLSKLVDDVPNLTDTDRRYLDATIPGMIRTVISSSKGGRKFRTAKKALKKAYRKGMDKISPVQISEDILHKIVVVIQKKNYQPSYICSNLIVMASMVMTMVEKYPTLSGMEKKNIVVKVLNQLVEKLPMLFDSVDPEDVELLKQSLRSLPDMIDTIVAVGNNKFEINQRNIIKTAGLLISMLTPCIKTCKK